MTWNFYTKEIISYVGIISFKRLMSLLGNYAGYFISILLKRPVILCLPYSSSIEPTTNCNLKCPECPVGKSSLTRNKGSISFPNFKEIINKIEKHTLYLSLYLQGEPLLNCDLDKMIAFACTRKIYTCISTNAHFLTAQVSERLIKAGLKKIIISLDGVSQETYSSYRINGEFEKVAQNIRILTNTRKELKYQYPLVVLQFIVFRTNEHEIATIKTLGKELGADRVEIKTAQHYDLSHKNPLITTNRKFSRYQQNQSGNWELKKKPQNRCLRLWTNSVFTWDGAVIPCCYDKDATYSLGNIYQRSFKTIWKGIAFMTYRRGILKDRKQVDICRNCGE